MWSIVNLREQKRTAKGRTTDQQVIGSTPIGCTTLNFNIFNGSVISLKDPIPPKADFLLTQF
jgi:hypothetical protein